MQNFRAQLKCLVISILDCGHIHLLGSVGKVTPVPKSAPAFGLPMLAQFVFVLPHPFSSIRALVYKDTSSFVDTVSSFCPLLALGGVAGGLDPTQASLQLSLTMAEVAGLGMSVSREIMLWVSATTSPLRQ